VAKTLIKSNGFSEYKDSEIFVCFPGKYCKSLLFVHALFLTDVTSPAVEMACKLYSHVDVRYRKHKFVNSLA
jgi:hypothetical protein